MQTAVIKTPKILPLVYLLATLAVMTSLHYLVPVAQVVRPPLSYVGLVLVIVGVAITAVSAGTFAKAGTPAIPFAKSTAVVTTGLYRYTRNPMYLGMVIALLGVAGLLGSIVTLFPILVFTGIIHNLFIRREETFLEELFGDEYRTYISTVRRWL